MDPVGSFKMPTIHSKRDSKESRFFFEQIAALTTNPFGVSDGS